MEALKVALISYGITIVFAMVIAVVIPILARGIKLLRLDADDAPAPAPAPANEEAAIAAAIAIAKSKLK
jgi:hypothetical protein